MALLGSATDSSEVLFAGVLVQRAALDEVRGELSARRVLEDQPNEVDDVAGGGQAGGPLSHPEREVFERGRGEQPGGRVDERVRLAREDGTTDSAVQKCILL